MSERTEHTDQIDHAAPAQNGAPQRVAFIGTGIMGSAMARHLLDAGYQLTVFNRTASKCADLVAHGACLAASPAEAVRDADVVITMVGYPEDVEELYLARGGLIDASKPGAYLIDMTTSSPELARDISQVASVSGRHALDAPVTGGPQGAQSATLTIFCGGTESDVAPVRAVLEAMGSHVLAFGGAGKGQMAKLANQTALAGAMVGLAEAFAFAKAGGLDVAQTFGAISRGMAGSAAMDAFGPKILADDFAPGFMVEHYVKDLGLVLATAEEEELTLPGVENANQLYNILAEIGGKRMGTQAIDLVYADEAACAAHGLDWSILAEDEDDEELGDFAGADHGDDCDCGCHDHDHGHAHAHAHGCGCGCEDGDALDGADGLDGGYAPVDGQDDYDDEDDMLAAAFRAGFDEAGAGYGTREGFDFESALADGYERN